MQFQPGDLVRYQWEDWKSPPKEEYIGIVTRIYKIAMVEVVWLRGKKKTLIFPESLILLARNNKEKEI